MNNVVNFLEHEVTVRERILVNVKSNLVDVEFLLDNYLDFRTKRVLSKKINNVYFDLDKNLEDLHDYFKKSKSVVTDKKILKKLILELLEFKLLTDMSLERLENRANGQEFKLIKSLIRGKKIDLGELISKI